MQQGIPKGSKPPAAQKRAQLALEAPTTIQQRGEEEGLHMPRENVRSS